ncbi:MAG: hypothetical protein JXB32_04985 [Deltaproteobacteria bacterium]|nr:hypothetical protein [Deltaproteobacteria bacterium]
MRMERWSWAVALLLLGLGCGGGSSGTPDGGDVPEDRQEAEDGEDVDGAADADVEDDADGADADADAEDGGDGADVDADADATVRHTAIALTAGGGRASSTGYQLTLSIGTPQPMGAAESGSHRVQVGPGAVVNQ